MRVALPEFDGRIVAVPFSFNEEVDDGDTPRRRRSAPTGPCPTGSARVAGLAVRLARLRSHPAGRRGGWPSCCPPTRPSAAGSATPSPSTPRPRSSACCAPCADAGYRVDRIPADGDALMAELIDAFTYERGHPHRRPSWPGPPAAGRPTPTGTGGRASTRPSRAKVEAAWGPAPGTVYRDPATGTWSSPGSTSAGCSWPCSRPGASASNPVAIYHSPDLPPTHHYLAFYRWLDEVWGADAIVHAGKHGTLEWLPGKGVGLSAALLPRRRARRRAARLPLRRQRPRRGHPGQAPGPRRHRRPPAAADDPGRHLRRHGPPGAAARRARPGRRPRSRPSCRPSGKRCGSCWSSAQLHRDLGVAAAPDGDAFDELVNHVDGYLCELKDAQIRGGLHVLGQAPAGRGPARPAPGPDPPAPGRRAVPAGHGGGPARRRPRRRAGPGRRRRGRGRVPAPAGAADRRPAGVGRPRPTLPTGSRDGLEPALDRTPDEIGARAGRPGRPVGAARAERGARPGAWPTCCRPGATSTRSTRRRCPSPLAWEVGQGLADRAPRAPPRRGGPLPGDGRAGRVGHRGHAHRGRRRGRGAGPARACGPSGRPSPAG